MFHQVKIFEQVDDNDDVFYTARHNTQTISKGDLRSVVDDCADFLVRVAGHDAKRLMSGHLIPTLRITVRDEADHSTSMTSCFGAVYSDKASSYVFVKLDTVYMTRTHHYHVIEKLSKANLDAALDLDDIVNNAISDWENHVSYRI
jgi:hypothetical protein